MKLLSATICAVALNVLTPAALVADEPGSREETHAALAGCVGISGNFARLACYDRVAAAAGHQRSSGSAHGRWAVSEDVNPVDDTKIVVAALEAVEGRSRHGGPIKLHVRCQSNLIEVFISWGQYLGGDDDKINTGNQKDVIVRIGDEKAYPGYWGISTDGAATFAPAQIQLLRKVVGAQRLVVRTTPLGSAPITATFDTTGMAEALTPVMVTCGYPSLEPAP